MTTVQSQVLQAMYQLEMEGENGVTDFCIAQTMRDAGIPVASRGVQRLCYPVVDFTLGRLRKLGLVERHGPDGSYGDWTLTLEGYAALGVNPEAVGT